MSAYEIKISSVLKFDSEKEKDIIDIVENLALKRKLGEFIAKAIRIVVDNQNLSDNKHVEEYGLTESRAKYFKNLESITQDMKGKTDKVFEMAYNLCMLGKFNKYLGIDEQANNLLQAQFILQRQINNLCETLGVDSLKHIYESNKLIDIAKKADESFEYIIDNYGSIVDEIKSRVSTNVQSVVQCKVDESNEKLYYDESVGVQTSKDSGNVSYTDNTTKVEHKDKHKEQSIPKESDRGKVANILTQNEGNELEDDEVIDFGTGADWDALNKFVGI